MKKAYSSLELLLSCIILVFCLDMIVVIEDTIIKQIKTYHFEEKIGFYQLREIIAQSKIISITSNKLTLNYEKEIVEIEFMHNRLVKQPGYHILLQNFQGDFNIKGECIYINEKQIYCEEGIHSMLHTDDFDAVH